MHILDFHTHIFPDDLAARAIEKLASYSSELKNHTDGTTQGLLKSMKHNGIHQAVVLPIATKPAQVSIINKNCLNLKSEKLIPFGSLHPETEDIEDEISFLKENGIPGVKFHPEYQNFYIDQKSMFTIYEQLSAAGLVVIFHAGKDPGPFTSDHALPAALKTVHKNFPNLHIVAAHMGGWKLWDEVEQQICGLPIFLDTSAILGYISSELFIRIVRKHGAEHILFGTDSPWYNQGDVKYWIQNSVLSDAEKSMIFAENGQKLLNAVWST